MRLSHFVTPLALAVFVIGSASPALAWDFSCSPKNTTEILPTTPNVMLMLDRSGSMGFADGRVARSCKVCEDTSGYFEVGSAADCPSGTPWSVFDESHYPNGSVPSGYSHAFSFTNLPATTHDMQLELAVGADINGSCEWADVYVDGDLLFELDNLAQCNRRVRTFSIPAAYAADGQVDIEIQTSADGNSCRGSGAWCVGNGSCDGVDAFCSDNYVEATLSHNPPVYHGTQAWADPCGEKDKWEQAVDSIDNLTFEAAMASPETAHFGLGLYHGRSAYVAEDCGPSRNDEIMSILGPYTTGESCPSGSTCPGGSTPTARAIRASRQSECVGGQAMTDVSDTVAKPQNGSVSGVDYVHTLSGINTTDNVRVTVELTGDYGHSCEIAHIFIEGVDRGTMTGTECGTISQTFTLPAADVADGEVEVIVDTRADGEGIDGCGSSDGVDTYCGTNRSTVTVSYPNDTAPPTATVLINDGQPTIDINGGDGGWSNYRDAVEQACRHRALAPLYVVGLGAGTDEDFNNILAAAGGTGTCTQGGMDVDPCDDVNNWDDLRGDCTGSIQTDNEEALLAALVDITASLACTFPIDFANSNVTEVPEDPTNEYEYMYVEVYDTATGTYRQVFHEQSSFAMPPGEGWHFSDDARRFVEFSDEYCSAARRYDYSEVSTQLACLCEEDTGTTCMVDNWQANGTCPEGTWICLEGTDICEPDTECCVPGPCDTGLPGVCAEGEIVCDGTPMGTCTQINDPSEEICDGLDNDCDGEVDEGIGGTCTVPNAVGRCAPGEIQCVNGAEVCTSVYDPMPELCNGLDDDCDGDVDNISQSWEKSEFDGYSLNGSHLGKACRYISQCVCNNGTDDHAGKNFGQYVTNWDPVCQCGEGLAPESGSSDDMPESASSEYVPASCSAAADPSSAPGWLFLLAGGLFVRRRR